MPRYTIDELLKRPMVWRLRRGSVTHTFSGTGRTGLPRPYDQFLLTACGRKLLGGTGIRHEGLTCKQCMSSEKQHT
jgi:hypothetical protein